MLKVLLGWTDPVKLDVAIRLFHLKEWRSEIKTTLFIDLRCRLIVSSLREELWTFETSCADLSLMNSLLISKAARHFLILPIGVFDFGGERRVVAILPGLLILI